MAKQPSQSDVTACESAFDALRETRFELSFDGPEVFVIISQLQLALRHPMNTGLSSELGRVIAERLIRAICYVEPGAAAILNHGFDPDYDISDDENDNDYE